MNDNILSTGGKAMYATSHFNNYGSCDHTAWSERLAVVVSIARMGLNCKPMVGQYRGWILHWELIHQERCQGSPMV